MTILMGPLVQLFRVANAAFNEVLLWNLGQGWSMCGEILTNKWGCRK